MAERWEQERGAWVLARAGRRAGARRRGEKLMVAARRHDRYEVGAGDASFAEVTTRNLFHRSVMREEGAANVAGWFCFTVLCALAVVALAGPALLVSRVAYGIWWAMAPRWGRMSSWPYAGLSVLLAGVAWLALGRLALAGIEAFLAWYGAVQVVLGVAWAGWLVRARGWAAVARRQKQSGSAVERISIEIPVDEPVDPVVEAVPSEPVESTADVEPVEIAAGIEPIEIEDIEDESSTEVTTTTPKAG